MHHRVSSAQDSEMLHVKSSVKCCLLRCLQSAPLEESAWQSTGCDVWKRLASNVQVCLVSSLSKWAIFLQKPTRQTFYQTQHVRKMNSYKGAAFVGSLSGSEGRGHAVESDMHSWSEATAGPGKHAPCGRNDVAARGHRLPLTPLFAQGSKNHIDFGSP